MPPPAVKSAALLVVSAALSFSQARIMVQPEDMALAKARLHTRANLPLGMWRVTVFLPRTAPGPVLISREQIAMAVPSVPFLAKEIALPILLSRNGGLWRQLAHYGMLAGMLAPGVIGGATISVHAVRWAGIGLASIEVIRKDLDSQTPDLSGLTIELPATILLQPGGGATFEVWASKVKGAHPLGPITLE